MQKRRHSEEEEEEEEARCVASGAVDTAQGASRGWKVAINTLSTLHSESRIVVSLLSLGFEKHQLWYL